MTVKILAASLMLTVSTITAAHAAAPVRIDQFGAWGAFSYKSDSGMSCYILSTPIAQMPSSVDHGDNFFIVAHPSGQDYVPEAMAGYDLRQGAPMTAMIGGKTFAMFTKDRHGWVQNEADQPSMIQALKSGDKLELHATSKRGTATSYTYSLSGVSAALERIGKCK
ncbi:invasion associated locus B family protein (plasmid) [Rhizobium sp. CB3090]|uniref:invasion associated locus B family protein n=1 Tax=Rhizobium sp. CB3090 TaxID=3039156 RepID=UPI0024B1302B|nr:invasion associated locus B family protein [Rhizobium sp. CB3090]WFU11936.1 invasion associated locus B family protein [Rhizobium sp. CB3090]